MNWTDVVILSVLALSVLIGLFRGLVAELLSLVLWVAVFWATKTFGPVVSAQLTHSISMPSVRDAVGYGSCFVAMLILSAIVRFVLRRLIWSSGLSGIDRMFGMVFGFLRGVLIVALMVFLVGLTGFTREPWWRESALAPQFQGVASWLGQAVPAHIPAGVRERIDSIHASDVLDKIHPQDMMNRMPDLSKLPHASMFNSSQLPASLRNSPWSPAAASSAANIPANQ